MCGFTGFTGTVPNNDIIINTMMDRIIHRGPDSSGIYSDEFVTLGFRRLSMIDLDGGSQPIFNEDKSIVVLLNGEIYNYKELTEELKGKGHDFYTKSDTEVLVHLYEEMGYDMITRLRGMFAAVIFDKRDNSLFGFRDYFGIKPFYYTAINGNLVFSSEIKSILDYPYYEKKVNTLALENYLTFQYSVLAETFFKGVHKLYPSHYLVFKEGKLTIKRYFEPKFDPSPISGEEAVDLIDKTILESIEYHKVSDVEVGSFLSSGVDSSYVASCFNGKKTFTVGFDYDKYNEISYAKNLAEKVGVENYDKMISKEDYWNVLPKIQYHMDEPLADPSAVALYFVSKEASKHLKIALSGEGADEFFGGYNIYKEPMDIKFLTGLPKFLRKFLGAVAKAIPFNIKGKNLLIRASQDVEERFIGNAKIFSKEEREKILSGYEGKYDPKELTKPYYDRIKGYDDVTKMQYIDIHFWLLGDILLKADKMSMANSLEVRVPFLDIKVFELASRLPNNLKVGKAGTKLAFRKAAHRHLPEEVANKKKLGFPVPIRIWLKEDEYYNKVLGEFSSATAKKFFKPEEIIKLLDRHKEGKEDNSRKIWTIYMFLVWHKEYFA
ncbi:MAG: asparagine synthase (glutamine-hydrolyzing) [Clostridiales bacterium]|nr:asparagine synthase (glutamine-hydrolyzing) [Clostridiales bacterium]